MIKLISFTFIISLLFLLASRPSYRVEEVPIEWPHPVYDFSKNPSTRAGVALGRKLFYEPKLSLDNSIACASCHLSYTAFTHVDHKLSHGIGDSIGLRNSPALVNLAWSKSFMWDGAVNHLDVQGIAPIEDPMEMGESIKNVIGKLQNTSEYPRLFFKAFGDSILTGEHLLKALSQFQLTLISANSKYDKVMRASDTASFTEQEENGYVLFKQHCNSCHKEPLFTTGDFANNGLPVDTSLMDLGRYRITSHSIDSLHFKIPTLRNIEFSFPYMHDGRFAKLRDVIGHYVKDVQPYPNLSTPLQAPIQLSSREQIDLISFLLTLTDKEFLMNPDHAFPRQPIKKEFKVFPYISN